MNTPAVLSDQGRRLLQLGVGLLLFTSFEGFVIPYFAAYVMASVWGAGSTTIHLAARTGRGSAFQESVIAATAYSSAPTGIIAFVLVLWGLRARTHR